MKLLNTKISILVAALVIYLAAAAARAEYKRILVSAGSTWKYLDDGSNQGTAWRSPRLLGTVTYYCDLS